jgi:isocitrate dehydrogenase (NAD+)
MEGQLERAKNIKAVKDLLIMISLTKSLSASAAGDGIGPIITKESQRVLEFMLKDQVESGKVEFKVIDGLTIENRAACMKAIPDDVLEELKQCHVILKGPTTTPHQGDGLPNIESANVAMRKALDLLQTCAPLRCPRKALTDLLPRRTPRAAMQ